MERSVKLYFYNNDKMEEITASSSEVLKINGVDATGETTQTADELTFSYGSVLPGSGGFEFANWQFSFDGIEFTIDTNTSFTLTPESDQNYIEVRCCLKPKTYKITYNYNNPDGTSDYEETVTYGETEHELIIAPPYAGYVFKGWRINGELYAAQSVFEMPASDVTANAEWVSSSSDEIVPQVTLTYEDPDTGEIDIVQVFKSIATALKSYTNSSGTGGGWTINGSTKKNKSTIIPNEDTEAKGKKNTRKYRIAYDTKGGKPYIASIQVTSNENGVATITMPDAPTKSGYTFLSWSGAGGNYAPGASVDVKDSYTFSAIYSSKEKVNVTLSANGSSFNDGTTQKTITVEVGQTKTYGNLEQPKDKAFGKFDGYYTTSATSGGQLITKDTNVLNPNNHTLWARWKKMKRATLKANGGTISPAGYTYVECSIGGKYVIADGTTPIVATKEVEGESATFLGWFDTASMTGGKDIETVDVKESNRDDINVYARFKHVVIFDVGEYGKAVDPQQYEAGKPYGSLPEPEIQSSAATDVKFLGWYTQAEKGYHITTSSTVHSKESQTLYAHYSNAVQTLTYELQNGKFVGGASSPQTFKRPGKYDGLYSEKFVERYGFTFGGWFTQTSGKGTEVHSGDTVTDADERTVYAYWKTQQCVRFDYYGGTCENKPNSSKYYDIGGDYDNFPVPTRPNGFTFEGFYDDPQSGQKVSEGDTVTEDTTRTLYARWKQDKEECTITLDANGGTACCGSKLVYEDDKLGGLPVPTKDDPPDPDDKEAFDAWLYSNSRDGDSVSARSGGGEASPSDIVTGAVTLTAHWVKKVLLYYVKDTSQN